MGVKAAVRQSDKRRRRRRAERAAAKAEEEAAAEADAAEAKAAQELKTSATDLTRQGSEGVTRRSKYVVSSK